MLDTYWKGLIDPKDPLIQFRKRGWELFEKIGLPRPKQEAFQYLTKKWTFPPLSQLKAIARDLEGVTFVDGFFEERLSILPSNLICLPLEKTIHSYGLFLQNRWTKMLKEETDPFAALNSAMHGRGAFIYLPPQCKAVLHLRQIFTEQTFASPRIHVYLGRGAELKLKQRSEGRRGFCNSVTDFVLDEGSQVVFHDEQEGDFLACRATLKKGSQFKAVLLGKVLRHSLQIQLAEENAAAEIYGLARLMDEEQQHIHATLEHRAPYTRSHQHFKSVVHDQSRFSFEGKIHVRAEAQKTESYQLNNNLILSDTASAYAKPNLEIFADDVKASHGATFGKLDEEELFYLRSRGLPLQLARDWLIEGFCKEIVDHAK